MLKAVLDTNVLISMFVAHANTAPRQIFIAWHKNLFTLLTCQEIINEVEDVIRRPKIKHFYQLTPRDIKEFLNLLRCDAKIVAIDKITPVITKDPEDDKILASALKGKANYIVSGDQHLLKLGQYRKIKVLTPKEFVKILETK